MLHYLVYLGFLMAASVCRDGGFGSLTLESIFSDGLDGREGKRQCLAPAEQIAVQVQEIAKKDLFSALLKFDGTAYLRVIRPFFEVRDICHLMGVSRAFLEVEENQVFLAERRINPFSLSIIRRYRNMSQLGERRWAQIQSYFSEAKAFSCNGRLQKGAQIADEEVIALVKHFSRLTDIYLTFCPKITSAAVVAIANNCPNLRIIDLSGSPITDIALEAIAKHCKCLTRIDLDHCKEITYEGVIELTVRCQMLKEISLYGCSSFLQNFGPALKNQYPAVHFIFKAPVQTSAFLGFVGFNWCQQW